MTACVVWLTASPGSGINPGEVNSSALIWSFAISGDHIRNAQRLVFLLRHRKCTAKFRFQAMERIPIGDSRLIPAGLIFT